MKKPQKKSFLPALNAVLPDWFTGKDVREIQGPVYIPPAGKAGSYRKELAADIARKASSDPFTQRNIYSGVQAGADFIPLVGEKVGVEEVGEDIQKGDYVPAAFGAAGTLLGAVPIVGDVGGKVVKDIGKSFKRAEPIVPGIKAYHGSPHSFEQFDISKIGTGEGAQAYGHGLYFAENEKTAKAYRDALKDRRLSSNEGAVSMGEVYTNLQAAAEKHGLHPDQSYQLVKQVQDKIDRGAPLDDIEYPVKKFNDAYYSIVEEAQRRGYKPNPGHMYEVDIAADPEAFLDWDKPLSEQPASVRARMEASVGAHPQVMRDLEATSPQDVMRQISHQTGGEIHMGLGDVFGGTRDLAGGAYSVPFTNEPAVSELLRNAGIPGIKYLDQGSRGAGEGSRNYVVFDPKIISIVKKYGLAGALAAGLISQDQAEAMERQGLGDEAEAAPAPAPPRSPVAALDERVMDEAYTTRQSPRDVLKRLLGLQ